MAAQVTLAGISEAFDASDIECLVRTAATVVCGDVGDLNPLQRELAERAHRMALAKNNPADYVDDDCAAPTAVYPSGSTARPDTAGLQDAEVHTDNKADSDGASDLVVRAFLELSTAHLTERTCRALNSYDGVTAYETTDGWLMYASAGAEEHAADGEWPPELLPIVNLARIHGCDYILFDADAPETDLLPTFDS